MGSAAPAESRVAIVTGAASGIGLALTHSLLSHDPPYKVAAFDIVESDALKELSANTDFAYYQCDIASYESQAVAFSATYNKWGRIDALCANAGIIDVNSIYIYSHRGKTEIPPAPDLRCTDIDYKGVVYGTQLAIHFMRQNPTPGGHIIATASLSGVHPICSLPEYCGAKAAVIGFCLSTAPVLKVKEDISFNVVCPGAVATPNIPPPMREAFGKNMTNIQTVVKAYHRFLDDSSLNGEIVEANVDQVLVQPKQVYGHGEASKLVGTVYDPLFAAIHGEPSGVPGATGGKEMGRREGDDVSS